MKQYLRKGFSAFLSVIMMVTLFIASPMTAFALQKTIDIADLSTWNSVNTYLSGPSEQVPGGYDLVKFWVKNDADYLYVRWDIQLWGNQTDLQSTYLNVVLSTSANGTTADAAAILSFDAHSAVTASLENLGTSTSVDLDAVNNVRLFNIGAQGNLVSVVARINFSAFNTIGLGTSFNATSAFPLWAQDNASQSPSSNIKDRIPATGYFSYDAANGEATIVGSTASSQKEILTYTLQGVAGEIDSAAGTISLTLPAGTDLTNLASIFTTSANTKAVTVNGANQTSGTTANDFTNPVTYVVTAEDGTKKSWVVTASLQEPAYDMDYTISTVIDTNSTGLSYPQGIAFDGDGNLYIVDTGNRAILKVDADGNASTLIDKTTIESFYGINTQEADYYYPTGIAVDSQGNVYIVDNGNSIILKADLAGGNISKFIDCGLNSPCDVAVDGSGNVYISDSGTNSIIKMSSNGQPIDSTYVTGSNTLNGLTVDTSGNVYVADSGNSQVYKISYDDNGETVDVVAGNGNPSYSGDGGLAIDAALNSPADVAVDSNGNLNIEDSGNYVIRAVDAVTRKIYTIAGTRTCGHSGDGGPALSADLSPSYYSGIEVDGNGNVYFSNIYYNVYEGQNSTLVNDNAVRKLTPQQQTTPEEPDVSVDDVNNKIIGADNTMEYSTDGGTTWIDYDSGNEPNFPGDQTVEVRIKATNTDSAGDITTLTFTANDTYSIEGTVVDDTTPTPLFLSGATVKVMRGNNQVGTTGTTDVNGLFTITGVPNGIYNLVVTKGTQIITLFVTVKDEDYNFGMQYIVLPTGNKNSELNVTGAGTPSVVVDGLNGLFNDPLSFGNEDQDVVDNGGTVLIKLTVELQEDADANGASDLQTLAGSQTIAMFLDMSLVKTLTDENGSTDTTLSTVGSLIKILVPYDLSGKTNVTIYRYHDGAGAKMTNLGSSYLSSTPSEEGYVLDSDNNQIVIWANNFSTYAIAYGATSSSEGPSSGGSSVSSYTITASNDLIGGSISPNSTVSVTAGGSKTFAIVPDDGYVISDVLVDGKSVGAVGSYTFSNITAAHTITVVFVKASSLPYYYNDKGDKVFIGFASDASGTMQYIAPYGETVLSQENPKAFTDIANHWGKSYIDFVTEREIFVGTGSNIFSPDTGMTRAMLATVIGRLYERSYGTLKTTGTHEFTDCDYNSWYGNYIDWCADMGIIKGVGGGKFEPDRQINRQEMATMFYRFAELLKVADSTKGLQLGYPDASSIASWAQEAALYCQETGIIAGRDGNAFAPMQTATRAEVAVILERFIELVV